MNTGIVSGSNNAKVSILERDFPGIVHPIASIGAFSLLVSSCPSNALQYLLITASEIYLSAWKACQVMLSAGSEVVGETCLTT